jgi:hypothetical protein
VGDMPDTRDVSVRHRGWECPCVVHLGRSPRELSLLFSLNLVDSCDLGEVKTKASIGCRPQTRIARNGLMEEWCVSKLIHSKHEGGPPRYATLSDEAA